MNILPARLGPAKLHQIFQQLIFMVRGVGKLNKCNKVNEHSTCSERMKFAKALWRKRTIQQHELKFVMGFGKMKPGGGRKGAKFIK